ncbi:ABC transporter permease [Desulfolithobacter dissulfuricans]|uniref:ABC transporter permease n=1 Tax=Desulfolithobacter dissulfuricans TaxID=2795293 RepID=A0A915XHS7_9BACT|nr:ABC transporter permease [Desulfolithobacter dissulfuricans]BCO08395.1 ABC transporter permease [Desulfolithobacter dissulfuricans]
MTLFTEGFVRALQLLASGDPGVYSAIGATVTVSTWSLAASLVIGVPAGFMLGYCRFPGKRIVRTIVDTLLALPTVFIGLVVYTLLSRSGPLGELNLLFSLSGIAIGQTVLGLPIIIALTASQVETLDQRLYSTLIGLGARPAQVLLATVLEARFGLLAAAVTAYGRILTEVGISMMVGGNIKYHTRTITTAIALETGKGEFITGIALGLVLLAIALVVNGSLSVLKKRWPV